MFTLLASGQQQDKKVDDTKKNLKAAESLFSEKKHTEAIEYYTKVLGINPNEQTALLKRGLCYIILKEDDKAITDFSALIKADENNSTAYYFRALAKFNTVAKAETPNDEENASACDDLFMAKQLGYNADYSNFMLICHNL
jgi:tetratricopeptide (TPR) repeat protein